jgi:hypothetical protein
MKILVMSKELKAQLKSLKHAHSAFTPRAAFVSETRASLIRSIAIEQAAITPVSSFLKTQSFFHIFLPSMASYPTAEVRTQLWCRCVWYDFIKQLTCQCPLEIWGKNGN